MRNPVPAITWSTSTVAGSGEPRKSLTPSPWGTAARTGVACSTSTTPSIRSFNHHAPAGPSTVCALVIRTSSGSRRKSPGEFQAAQCHPSQSLFTGRRILPSRLNRAGFGLSQLIAGRLMMTRVSAPASCSSAAVSSAD